MRIQGTFKNERLEFDVELFSDHEHRITFLVLLNDTKYMLVRKNVDFQPWLQISGSFIMPEFRQAIFAAMSSADQSAWHDEIKPLRDLDPRYLR
ncbi:hypothetical protein AAFN85_16280 [Mucilaginibacter sp. CAU 1740]|uniref:hypothetical protein n=1 Tax=Mucilaginibacter sp. CAU 1740 TaxID=3140365 RepID=UPI00325BF53D